VLKIDPSSEVEKISEKVQVKGTRDHTYPTRHEKPVKRRESSVLPENILTFTRTVSALTLAMVLFKHVGG
jgi:hypothetical protein